MVLPARYAEQSVSPGVAWKDTASDVCAMEPALRQPRPVASGPPKPAVQLHRCVELPAKGAEQSALPRVAWQDVTSDVCAMGPALQYPRPVISNQPKPAVQSR